MAKYEAKVPMCCEHAFVSFKQEVSSSFFAAVLEIRECLRVCGADCNGDVQRQLPRRSRHDRRDAGSAPAGEGLVRTPVNNFEK